MSNANKLKISITLLLSATSQYLKAAVAKCRNKKFKAKSIRNDVVLHKSSFETSPDYVIKKMVKLLNKREDDWTQKQKSLLKLKIEEKMEIAKKQGR